MPTHPNQSDITHDARFRWRGPLILSVVILFSVGCSDMTTTPKSKQAGGGAKVKTTDDIGEFKAQDGKQVVDSKVKITNPITGPLEAYEPLKQQISELAITQAVQLFHATEGRYPKDYDEFMTRVIKQNNIRLPVLSPGKHYEYDVAEHCLMVVTDAPN
ncbi:MAG: hypothetical protein R3C59_16405 [Planctomycetaceae bacterium]